MYTYACIIYMFYIYNVCVHIYIYNSLRIKQKSGDFKKYSSIVKIECMDRKK